MRKIKQGGVQVHVRTCVYVCVLATTIKALTSLGCDHIALCGKESASIGTVDPFHTYSTLISCYSFHYLSFPASFFYRLICVKNTLNVLVV